MGQYGLQAQHGRDIVIAIVVIGALSILSVILRIVARRMKGLNLALDDYLILLAMVFVIASSILVITTVTKGGVGRHMTDVAFEDVEYTLKMIIPCQALYGVGLAIVKTSMMTLYYRLFGSKTSIRVAIYAVGAIVWGWGMSIVLESFLLCTPIEFNWNPTLPGGKCGNRNAAFVAAGVLNMITDFMVILLPIPYIWGLQLPTGRRIGLVLIFCLSLFVSAISMIRVVSLLNINFDDATYTLPLPLMWSIVEEQLAITCANLPLLGHVVASCLPKGWLSSARPKYGSTNVTGQRKNGSQLSYSLTRMNAGVNKTDISTGRAETKDGWVRTQWSDTKDSPDSDTELAPHGAPLDGIHISREFQVGSQV